MWFRFAMSRVPMRRGFAASVRANIGRLRMCAGVVPGLLGLLYHLPGQQGLSETPAHLEDSIDALVQLTQSGNVILPVAMAASVVTIAFYNFFGISVTKAMSAGHRTILDSTRTVFVWVVFLGWHHFDESKGQPFSTMYRWA